MFNNKRNKTTVPILILMMIIMLLATSCSRANEETVDKHLNTDIQKNETENIHTPYNYRLLYSYRNISLNDMEKLMELVSLLQYARELPIDRIEFKNENREILRIDYRMNLTEGQEYKVNHSKWMADVVILLTLLDDLNAVEFNLVQGDYSYGGIPITREQAGDVLGEDIRALGKTEEAFLLNMPEIIADFEWNPGLMNIITYEHITS